MTHQEAANNENETGEITTEHQQFIANKQRPIPKSKCFKWFTTVLSIAVISTFFIALPIIINSSTQPEELPDTLIKTEYNCSKELTYSNPIEGYNKSLKSLIDKSERDLYIQISTTTKDNNSRNIEFENLLMTAKNAAERNVTVNLFLDTTAIYNSNEPRIIDILRELIETKHVKLNKIENMKETIIISDGLNVFYATGPFGKGIHQTRKSMENAVIFNCSYIAKHFLVYLNDFFGSSNPDSIGIQANVKVPNKIRDKNCAGDFCLAVSNPPSLESWISYLDAIKDQINDKATKYINISTHCYPSRENSSCIDVMTDIVSDLRNAASRNVIVNILTPYINNCCLNLINGIPGIEVRQSLEIDILHPERYIITDSSVSYGIPNLSSNDLCDSFGPGFELNDKQFHKKMREHFEQRWRNSTVANCTIDDIKMK